MSKKKINKIKTKQKQKQKQTQNVIVNIHKSTRTRKPTNNETPRRNVQQLPTPQYIYTSQTDKLVPQMFNKQGQQETLAEQINKTLDEKINKLVSQYTTKPAQPPQPTQQEVRETRSDQFDKPNITTSISGYGKSIPKQEVPKIFNNKSDVQLSNIQTQQPSEKATMLVKSEPETIYVTNTPANTPAKVVGFEQKSGYSVKPGNESGYKSESGYKTEGGMSREQSNEVRKERLKQLLGNKPEEKIPSLTENIKEKIPSLIESIKNKQEAAKKEHIIQQKEIEQMGKNDNESLRHQNNEKLFDLIEQQKKINRKLTKIEKEKKNAVHGTKGTFDNEIKEHKSKLKSTTLNIEILKNKIKSIK